jgi:hypothetical protein
LAILCAEGLISLDARGDVDVNTLVNLAICWAPLAVLALVAAELLFVRVQSIEEKAWVEIRRSSIDGGNGAFTTRAIARGSFLGKYKGENMSLEDLLKRYPPSKLQVKPQGVPDGGSDAEGNPRYAWRVHDDFFVDSADPRKSNWCRFVNHAPAPNANVHVYVAGLRSVAGGVYLFAATDLNEGVELLCDYGPTYWAGRAEGPA